MDRWQFDLFSFYSVIDVHLSDLTPLGNRWTKQHVRQGFSWRPGNVSFGLLSDVGGVKTSVSVESEFALSQDAERAILVPFYVDEFQSLSISDLVNTHEVSIRRGDYGLVFEIGKINEEDEWCNLTFFPKKDVKPEILLADEDLDFSYPLVMYADPP